MKNLEAKIEAVQTDRSVLNQFSISIQLGSAMQAKDPGYFYEEFKGNKSATIKKLKQYVALIQAKMFEDDYNFLAYLNCSTKDRKWNTKELFSHKIQVG